MNREGASFARWLFGRLAHSPHLRPCSTCGSATVVAESSERLREAGERRLATWSRMCASCRREQRARWLARELR